MPMRQKPEPGEVETEPFTPDGLDSEGPFREYFDLKTYLDPKDGAECRKASTVITLSGKEKKEENDQPLFWKLIFKRQVVGWRSIVPPDKKFNKETMYLEDGIAFWKFIEPNIDRMTEDVFLTVFNEVMSRGGFISSRILVTKGPDGRDVTFRWTDAELGVEHLHDVSAGLGDVVLPDVEPGVGVSAAEPGVLAQPRPGVDKRPRGDAKGAKRGD